MSENKKLMTELARVLKSLLPCSEVNRLDEEKLILIRQHGGFYLRILAAFDGKDTPVLSAGFERIGVNHQISAEEVLELQHSACEAQNALRVAEEFVRQYA